MFVRACPRPMHNVLCAGTIEARALWIRTRESGISLRRWRRLCHGGPPVVRNGPKDTDLTPVAPRYCSPGLPNGVSLWKIRIIEPIGTLLRTQIAEHQAAPAAQDPKHRPQHASLVLDMMP